MNGPWGDAYGSKQPWIFRYCFTNMNGLPSIATHERHDQIIQATTKYYKIDLLGSAEININYTRVGPTNQWKDRFKKLRTNSHCATNIHSTSQDKRLFGGTAYLTTSSASHKVENEEDDPTGLGRWTWALLSGRQGIKTTIISGYRLVRDTSNRAGTVFSQHEQFFTDQKEPRDPRKACLDDLEQCILTWIEECNNILLGLDLNDSTWNSDEAHQIESWGLINAHKTRHPDLPPVATCNKNT
jgi:hypothetical protein